MKKSRAHILISGAVQGVCFRYETRTRAQSLGLTGWVRNTADGKVEAVFEGNNDDVQRMVDWCRHGPSGAVVSNLKEKWEEYIGEFNNFDISFTRG